MNGNTIPILKMVLIKLLDIIYNREIYQFQMNGMMMDIKKSMN